VDLIEPIPLRELLEYCPFISEKIKSLLPDVRIHSVDSPESSNNNSLTFISKNNSKNVLSRLKCTFAFSEWEAGELPCPSIQVENILPLVNQILEYCTELFSDWTHEGIQGPYTISDTLKGVVDKRVEIGPGCFVGQGSVIKSGCVLEPGVTVLENCFVEENVQIQTGVVIGSAGFGFYAEGGEKISIRHGAGVHIARDCWIGANTVIAAGVLNPTFLGHSSKIDSHVQIAHNVSLGHHAVIASQSGIAGSTRIGHHLLMGGASSIGGHLNIGSHVSVAARTGVTKHIKEGQVIAGFPAQPINKWKRQQVHLRKL